MKLAVSMLPVSTNELEGMNAETTQTTSVFGKAAATEEEHQSVGAFGLVDVKIPELEKRSGQP